MIEDLENYNESLELEIDSLKQICFNRAPCDINIGVISLEIIANPILEITNIEAHIDLINI